MLLFQNEFREYPSLLRHAVSLGRRIQDPLAEFAALCVEEDELLCLRLHPFQVRSKNVYDTQLFISFFCSKALSFGVMALTR